MFADVLMPPTLVFDWYALGFPAGLIVFLAVAASVFTTAVVLSRRRVRGSRVVIWSIVLFVGADLLAYFVGTQVLRPTRRNFPPDVRDEIERKTDTPGKPNE